MVSSLSQIHLKKMYPTLAQIGILDFYILLVTNYTTGNKTS